MATDTTRAPTITVAAKDLELIEWDTYVGVGKDSLDKQILLLIGFLTVFLVGFFAVAKLIIRVVNFIDRKRSE